MGSEVKPGWNGVWDGTVGRTHQMKIFVGLKNRVSGLEHGDCGSERKAVRVTEYTCTLLAVIAKDQDVRDEMSPS